MAIPQSTILGHRATTKSAEMIKNAKAALKQTAFLAHSHLDDLLAKSVQAFLQSNGWEVYIDWEDTMMPETPNRDTALRIQSKIRDLNWFLFLATSNSCSSRWCPWEIGYADGVKPTEKILVLPTSDSKGSYGNEYLQLYRRLEPAQGGGFGAFQPDNSGVNIGSLRA